MARNHCNGCNDALSIVEAFLEVIKLCNDNMI